MPSPHVHDVVRLKRDVPTLWLKAGAVGVVQSSWLAPHGFFEIEFEGPDGACRVRVLLGAEQLEVVQRAPATSNVLSIAGG
jgi:hypothetical protein